MVGLESSWAFEVERGPGWLFVTPRTLESHGTAELANDVSARVSRHRVDQGATTTMLEGPHSFAPGADESALGFADRVWDILDQHFVYRVVLELDELRELPDDLIKQLIELHQRVTANHGLMRLSALDADCTQRLLGHCDLPALKPHPDRASAVMGYHRAR